MEKSAPPNPAKRAESLRSDQEKTTVKEVAENIGEDAVKGVVEVPEGEIEARAAEAAQRVLKERTKRWREEADRVRPGSIQDSVARMNEDLRQRAIARNRDEASRPYDGLTGLARYERRRY